MTQASQPVRGRVAVTSSAVTLDSPKMVALAGSGVEFVQIAAKDSLSAEFRDRAAGCHAIIAGAEAYPAPALAPLEHLSLIARSGVGYDQIDLTAATDLGIAVTVTPGVNADTVAEHTVSLMLACLHRTVAFDARVRRGAWRDGTFFPELRGSRVGVVGLGRIGRGVAGLVAALGAEVHGYDPAAPDGAGLAAAVVRHSTLEGLLPAVDILTLHVPLITATRGLIGAKEIGALRPGAYLVNTSRGGVIDEGALIAALASGHLAGAGLDVFADEPPAVDNPLLAMPQCVLSPHIASFGRVTITAMSDMIAGQIADVLDGRLPTGMVNVLGQVRPLPQG